MKALHYHTLDQPACAGGAAGRGGSAVRSGGGAQVNRTAALRARPHAALPLRTDEREQGSSAGDLRQLADAPRGERETPPCTIAPRAVRCPPSPRGLNPSGRARQVLAQQEQRGCTVPAANANAPSAAPPSRAIPASRSLNANTKGPRVGRGSQRGRPLDTPLTVRA